MTMIPTQLRQKCIDVGAYGAIVSVFYLWQSDIRKISEDIFKLGILHGTSNEGVSVERATENDDIWTQTMPRVLGCVLCFKTAE